MVQNSHQQEISTGENSKYATQIYKMIALLMDQEKRHHPGLHNIKHDVGNKRRVKKRKKKGQSSNDLPLSRGHDFQTPEKTNSKFLSSPEGREYYLLVNDALVDYMASIRKSSKKGTVARGIMAPYIAISANHLKAERPFIFKNGYETLEKYKNSLEAVLAELFPWYNNRKKTKKSPNISVAGWLVKYLLFPAFIHQIDWTYEFFTNLRPGLEIRTKDNLFESGSTYFLNLMKDWFIEYENLLKEVRRLSLWEQLEKTRTWFGTEQFKQTPGFFVHHLEFGRYHCNLQSLSWIILFKWLSECEAKWSEILQEYSTTDTLLATLFKKKYNFEIHMKFMDDMSPDALKILRKEVTEDGPGLYPLSQKEHQHFRGGTKKASA
ncbi:hypothetical protein CROQUDRAFT_718647 [Cronartium quercuum f. sp. fusiforme G11]|uniref:Uncharacterized protein n=1 Tax=Cronartium quercuum f. sp. fusiforme G11 TaxID=708437 RepID=A0A9P6N719_9BASI|nr:hypothetical protein CROQUDRAFT_718647 [Cronartium quercuum f. sp. fusiforme G11]